MATLLLRLEAPLQSYGTGSKFEIRKTDALPSKSALIGLLAAALGRRRDSDLQDLNALRFGVRADLPGEVTYDFQMARLVRKKRTGDDVVPYITYRYYIQDGIFLVGFESEDMAFLRELDEAMHHPVFHLFLGRKSYVPTPPISLGVRDLSLEDALRQEAWLVPDWRQSRADRHLLLQFESTEGTAVDGLRRDHAVSFDPAQRLYADRAVYQDMMTIDAAKPTNEDTEHDIFAALEEEESCT